MKMSSSRQGSLANNKGFTLIEMAIVLVIIGVIIGAVVKGQDLVDNAKSKQFASKIQAWQVALSTYYDRKGRWPGDSNRDGMIASGGTPADNAPLDDINSASFESAPESSFTLGGTAFAVSLGSIGGKNYLVVTKPTVDNYSPDSASDKAALKFFESYDTSIDGTADAKAGTVQGYTSAAITTGAKLTGLSGAPTDNDWLANTTIQALGVQLK